MRERVERVEGVERVGMNEEAGGGLGLGVRLKEEDEDGDRRNREGRKGCVWVCGGG